jgi:hypothetical protein
MRKLVAALEVQALLLMTLYPVAGEPEGVLDGDGVVVCAMTKEQIWNGVRNRRQR